MRVCQDIQVFIDNLIQTSIFICRVSKAARTRPSGQSSAAPSCLWPFTHVRAGSLLREISNYVFAIVFNVFESKVKNDKHDAAFVALP